MTCGWWNRWLHRRRREYDRLFILAPVAGLAAARHGEGPRADAETLMAWLMFIAQRGQEHWLCDCGIPEQTQLVETLTQVGSGTAIEGEASGLHAQERSAEKHIFDSADPAPERPSGD